MISFNQALSLVRKHARPLPTERIPLEASPGRVLRRALKARFDVPLFDNSAMDGYGVRLSDVGKASPKAPASLQLTGTVQAGHEIRRTLGPGRTVKIFTGARIPPGVEAVVMREYCEEQGGQIQIRRVPQAGEHIRRKGEEFQRGDEVIPAGTRITPAVAGMLATFGYDTLLAYKMPRVHVVVTGDELLEPGSRRVSGKIYDSNSITLEAALAAMGISEVRTEQCGDKPATLKRHLARALDSCDVLITVGGVSVGDYDLVKEVLTELGVNQVFWRVAMKPGKPNYLGVPRRGSRACRLVFGLPGNPVSALVSFLKLVKPGLLEIMGREGAEPMRMRARLATPLKKKPGRLWWVQGVVKQGKQGLSIKPLLGQGSHMLGSLTRANGLFAFEADKTRLPRGQELEVELIDWSG